MRSLWFVCAASMLMLTGACSGKGDKKKGEPSAKPAKVVADAAPKAKPKPKPGTRGSADVTAWSCNLDLDCMNSCSQGAVTTRWYRVMLPGGESCEDGCASKNMGPPKCVEKRCAAFDVKGKPVAECTKVAGKIESPGPAHKCKVDADCRASCRYGAVNAAWYKANAKPECKDGCARKGTDPPKCEKGACVNYFQGKPDTICTRRAIWN